MAVTAPNANSGNPAAQSNQFVTVRFRAARLCGGSGRSWGIRGRGRLEGPHGERLAALLGHG